MVKVGVLSFVSAPNSDGSSLVLVFGFCFPEN